MKMGDMGSIGHENGLRMAAYQSILDGNNSSPGLAAPVSLPIPIPSMIKAIDSP